MDDTARAQNGALLPAQAAAIETRLTRLRVAAALAQQIARLGAAEAESLNGEGRDWAGRGAPSRGAV